MTEKSSVLPLADIFAEMRKTISVRLERPQLDNSEHLKVIHRLNEETAAAGQVSIDTDKPELDSINTEKAWANGDLGYFRFVMDKDQIVGAVWSLRDTHVRDARKALNDAGMYILVHSDDDRHREASSYIFEETANADKVDFDASMLQLADEFSVGAHGDSLETLAVYMDGVNRTDRQVMHDQGYKINADGVHYKGSEEPCTVFIATKDTAKQAIIARAKQMGISTTPTTPSALR
jgi:hypothetical protein